MSKTKVVADVKAYLQRTFVPVLSDMNTDEYYNYIFRIPSSTRLTYDGLHLLVNVYPDSCHKYELESRSLAMRHLVTMAREFKNPYFIGNGYLVLFDNDDAVMISLCGSLINWLESTTSGRRLNK